MTSIRTFDAPLRMAGLELGCRMTVMEIGGDLLLHSPIAIEPDRIQQMGTPRWVLAPNRLHHMYVGPWLERGLEGWAAPGLPKRRKDLTFDHVVDEVSEPFGDEVLLIPLRCFSFTNEVVALHRPSGSLIVTDLVFHMPADAPWMTRTALWACGAYPGCRVTVVERLGMKREVAREEIGQLLEMRWDRLIMSHGTIIETGGKDALREAYRWLLG